MRAADERFFQKEEINYILLVEKVDPVKTKSGK